jgi:ribonuclease P protein component
MQSLRLNQPDQFRRIFKTGSRLDDNGLFLFWIPSPDGQLRVATVVRKKTYRHAVDRNRVRRVLREVVRKHRAELGSAWIVFDLKQTTTICGSSLYDRSKQMLRKSGLLRSPDEVQL